MGYALSFASEKFQNDIELLRIVKSDKERLISFDKKWFTGQMKILEILEEAWMIENNPQAPLQHKSRKF